MEPVDWHRLFGLSWSDLLSGEAFQVDIEVDLSRKVQLLDVVVVRKEAGAVPSVPLPDGFEELATHNLISFKSFQETLDDWTLDELVGHYVNYRKQVSPNMKTLLPETEFRLFAVSARFPQQLHQQVELIRVAEGVYHILYGARQIRIVVVGQLPRLQHNALLHLFSANEGLVHYGLAQYRPRSEETSRFLLDLFRGYQQEGLPMPFTVEEFNRQLRERLARDPQFIQEVLEKLSVDDLLQKLSPEQRNALLERARETDTPSKPT